MQVLDITVDEANIEEGAKKIIKFVRPQWPLEECMFKMFTEGITNKLMACQHKDDSEKKDVLLIRIYGQKTDLIIDRELELINMNLMHISGCSKPLYARFKNGIVYGFIAGECLDESTVREPHISRLISKEMVRMHAIDPDKKKDGDISKISIIKSPCLFTKLKKYIDICPDEFPDQERNERYMKDIMSKEEMCKELENMKLKLEPLDSPVVFCHNDLLLKNLVHSKTDDRVYFIDFEYGAFNYEAYDIANHFCEYAGIDTVDYKLYPNKEYQLGWLRTFLEQKCEVEERNAEVTDMAVERLFVQTNQFALMAHFFWGVWALIQARYSTIDFDYLDYAVIRFNEYFAKKDQFLALQMPEM